MHMVLAIPGPTELWIILAVVLVVFGARKLPELAHAMGSSINQFKKGLKENPELPPAGEGGEPSGKEEDGKSGS